MEAAGGSQSVWGWLPGEADPRRVCEGGIGVTVAAYLIFSKKESK